MMILRSLLLILFIAGLTTANAQSTYWQQRTSYDIAIDFDADNNSFRGKQTVVYENNSPDTLKRLYFHLYYNAFNPNSMMDQWAQDVPDPAYGLDFKLKYLTSSETGWIKVTQVIQNYKQTQLFQDETLMEVVLNDPIPPGGSEKLEMSFAANIPLLCRRTGRDNEEGIEYTMAQWYPKLCVYDSKGWQATPFIGREFYADFGDYDIKIRIDSSYILAAGCDEVSSDTIKGSSKKQWHFISKNALDFSWTADPDYQYKQLTTIDGINLHFYYQEEQNKENRWPRMAEIISDLFPYINDQYGKYPYKNFSIIQGGDGATEYSKSTFITGERNLGSLVGVSIHELMHSWFQHRLANQENRYSWMDEGFASYATTRIKQYMREQGIFFGEPESYPLKKQYEQYAIWAKSGFEEAMNTPANFFQTNTAHDVASYSKGELFLDQLNYIVGDSLFEKGMRTYITNWSFKHPNPDNFIREMEKASNIELDWYQHFWINSTLKIDYAVSVDSINETQSMISIQRLGQMPMPIDLEVSYTDGSIVKFIIPVNLMNGFKPIEDDSNQVVLQNWPWTHRLYQLQLNTPIADFEKIQIDPKLQMADLNRSNNTWTKGMKE